MTFEKSKKKMEIMEKKLKINKRKKIDKIIKNVEPYIKLH